jgi:hypothetical protein
VKYRIVAEVGESTHHGEAPGVGDHCTVSHNQPVHLFTGTITEVTPILSAEDVITEIEKAYVDSRTSPEFSDRYERIMSDYRSQEKPE